MSTTFEHATPTIQTTALLTAERLIRKKASKRDVDDLLNLFRVEVNSGVPITQSMAAISQWITQADNPPPHPVGTITNHSTSVQFGKITPSILRSRRNIGESARVVFEGLLTFRNDKSGEAFCSVSTLAERIDMYHRAVQRGLRKLESVGLIEWTGRSIGWGSRVYLVHLEMPADRTTTPMAPIATPPMSLAATHNREEKQTRGKTTTPPHSLMPVTIQNGVVVSFVKVSEHSSPIMKSPPRAETIEPIHPALTEEDQITIRRMIAKLTGEQSGQVVAELQARLSGQGETIRNPPAFTSILIKAIRNGTFAPSASRMAKDLQEAREQVKARQEADQEAERHAEEAEAKAKSELDFAKARLTVEEMKAHRAAFIEQLREQLHFAYATHKASGFQSFGFGILFDGYLRKTLLV